MERLEEVLQPISAHPFLQLLPGTGDTLATANLPYAKKKRLIRHFSQLRADVIIVDIGAGTSYHALDFSHGRLLSHGGDTRSDLWSLISTGSLSWPPFDVYYRHSCPVTR